MSATGGNGGEILSPLSGFLGLIRPPRACGTSCILPPLGGCLALRAGFGRFSAAHDQRGVLR
jgi:hypothetical protein